MRRSEKFRGYRTHGRGKKAGRGAGMRGGRGNAGLHKHKYITVVKNDPKHFGRYGFTRPKSPLERPPTTINVSQLEERLDRFQKEGIAKKTQDRIEVDLSSAGIEKLLGSGKLQIPLYVKVKEASERAKSKVEDAGGEVLLSGEKSIKENISEAE